MMCWVSIGKKAAEVSKVSVAGCLGYDVPTETLPTLLLLRVLITSTS
jgi:hypothetical protein